MTFVHQHLPKPRLLATGNAVCNKDLKILVQKDHTLWLYNSSDKTLEVGPAELFGFGLGGSSEATTSQAKLDKNILMFHIQRDSDLVVFQEGGGEKKLIPVASLIFQQAQKHGVMDVGMVDHKLTPMTQVLFSEGF